MKDYSRQEILDIVEKEADQQNIERDDFLRFAHAQTGGRFDASFSKGVYGAQGLFQLSSGISGEDGVSGKELDPVANTTMAARFYVDNQRLLISQHDHNGYPYLSGNAEPAALDMHLAHQHGVAGYGSMQKAMATGEFTRSETRNMMMNHMSPQDFEKITGENYLNASEMSDKQLTQSFVKYWDAKLNRVQIVEKGIEPLNEANRTQNQDAQIYTDQEKNIDLKQAYNMSLKHDDIAYGFGSKHLDSGRVDCSGWVVHLQNATMAEINQKSQSEIFTRADRFSLHNDAASTIVQKAATRSGMLLEGKDVNAANLREGMIIGEDNGQKSWDRGRFKGIDHIAMVIRNPATGALMISQSSFGKGVNMMAVDEYLKTKEKKGTLLFSTDPLSKGRTALRGGEENLRNMLYYNDAADSDDLTEGYVVVKQGSQGDAVKAVQAELARQGYVGKDGKPLHADGVFGKHTEHAVKEFQRKHGLDADGIAGVKTLTAMKLQLGAEKMCNVEVSKMNNPGHPDYPLYLALSSRLPELSKDRITQAAIAVKAANISEAQINKVMIHDDKLYITSTVPTVRAEVDLNQPVPTVTELQKQNDDINQQQAQQQAKENGQGLSV